MIGELTDAPRTIVLDDYRRQDGSLDEETAANNLASVPSEPIIAIGGHQNRDVGLTKRQLSPISAVSVISRPVTHRTAEVT
jgi:hypothetical protein